MKNANNQEIEVKFLEIDVQSVVSRLKKLGAKDLGEDTLREVILYDQKMQWLKDRDKFVRVRGGKRGVQITYKHHKIAKIDGTTEIELSVNDFDQAVKFLEAVGLVAIRYQEKRRRTFLLDGVTIDIDTWPKVPTYIELEGDSEKPLRKIAQDLGFDWDNSVFLDARKVLEDIYSIPVGKMKFFTFDRFE